MKYSIIECATIAKINCVYDDAALDLNREPAMSDCWVGQVCQIRAENKEGNEVNEQGI